MKDVESGGEAGAVDAEIRGERFVSDGSGMTITPPRKRGPKKPPADQARIAKADHGWITKAEEMAAPWDWVSEGWIEKETAHLLGRIRGFRESRGVRHDDEDRLFRDAELLVGELLRITATLRTLDRP